MGTVKAVAAAVKGLLVGSATIFGVVTAVEIGDSPVFEYWHKLFLDGRNDVYYTIMNACVLDRAFS